MIKPMRFVTGEMNNNFCEGGGMHWGVSSHRKHLSFGRLSPHKMTKVS